MIPEQLKSNNRYIFYRIYCVIVILIWIYVFAFIGLNNQHLKYFLLMALFSIPAWIMVTYNWATFPFKYSILGPNIRQPFPLEPPIFEERMGVASIGFGSYTYTMKMYIFKSGLGISLFGSAKVFIPKNNIISLELKNSQYRLIHNCPELRSPIWFFGTETFEKIEEILI